MIARRDLLASTLLSGVVKSDGAAVPEMSERTAEDLVKAVVAVHDTIDAQNSFGAILPLRTRMVDHLRANGKFPDYIDVGIDVWFAVYDWHIRHLQPMQVTRDTAGRYVVSLMMTLLVLKTDSDRTFIGIPYDNR